MKKEDDIIALAKKRFESCQDAESDNRDHALDDIEFVEGEQWPEDVKTDRERDQRPCLTINKVPLFVRQIVNDIRQIRPSIKVRPVDSESDPETAEIINGMIRAIEQDSAAESAYDWAAEYAVKGGFGFWRIITDYEADDSFEQCIKIERIRNPFAVYIDPAAQAQDASDMRYAFVVERLEREVFESKYPDAQGQWDWGDEYDDWWFGEDFVRVAEYWEVETEEVTLSLIFNPQTGMEEMVEADIKDAIASRKVEKRTVRQRIITGSEILEETEWPGKYVPIVRVLGREVDIQGEVRLKGMVRDMKDAQRQYNYMRSASVERIALTPKAPWVGPEGTFVNPKWRTANKKNHAYLDYKVVPGQPPPWRDKPPEVSSGLVAEIQTSSEELKAVAGIFNPGLGDRSNEVSGVAIDSRRGESDLSNYDFVDNLARSMTYSGKILVDLIPKIYGVARMIRIIKPDGSDESVKINEAYVDEKTMKRREYNLSAGRYDVSVDIGPSYSTQRKEAVDSMLDVLKAFPQAAQVMGDLLAKNFDWPDADEISKRLKLLLPVEIIKGENPAFQQAIMQKDQQIQQLTQQMQVLMTEAQRMSVELQNKMVDARVKEGDLRRKIAKDIMDHQVDMTDLELQANRDLSPQGMAY